MMERKEAVRRLIGMGEIPTKEAIEKIISSGAGEKNKEEKRAGKIEVRICAPERKERLGVEDFVSYYNSKYENIRGMLSSKLSAVSINKAKESFGDVGVIAMVRERTHGGYLIEDTTGSMALMTENGAMEPDDVVGITGSVREKKLVGKDVVWPDIPLTHKSRSMGGVSVTLSRKPPENKEEKQGHFYFSLDGDGGKTTKIPNGSIISISDGDSRVSILFYSPGRRVGPKECISLLRKRHLSPEKKDIVSPKDEFAITEIPDILWVDSDMRFVDNYKGVVVVSPGSEELTIDLGEKKVF